MLDDDGQELRDLTRTPLAGFRLAALTKITVQSWQATCNAAEDLSPTRLFAATSQVPREGPRLQRLVFRDNERSEEHTSELQSLMRISYAVFCLKKKNRKQIRTRRNSQINT